MACPGHCHYVSCSGAVCSQGRLDVVPLAPGPPNPNFARPSVAWHPRNSGSMFRSHGDVGHGSFPRLCLGVNHRPAILSLIPAAGGSRLRQKSGSRASYVATVSPARTPGLSSRGVYADLGRVSRVSALASVESRSLEAGLQIRPPVAHCLLLRLKV